MERSPRDCCALCGNTEFHPKLTISRRGDDFSIVQCGGCEHVFVADPPADTANHVEIEKIDWAFRPRHHQIRRLILAHLKSGQRVLEIGCGRGEVGYLLRDDPVVYQGYEPARGLSDFGIRAGVPIIQEIYRGGDTADAIVIDNVIEHHVAEPRQMVEVAARSLRPGGLVIVITPNVHDVRAIFPQFRKRHLWIPPDHINYFSARDIDFIFTAANLPRPQRFRFFPLSLKDYRFFPRAFSETLGLSIFGHNVFAIRD
ncbi:SAM-dependent methyltransferase [Bradyrhizobium sp. LA6.10]|uniref:class I SAM-dependent methyltransferase n=1 Tax=Bradyrhizobium sp. LA6.10 TaxID=3156318 RepID=UPI0033937EEB